MGVIRADPGRKIWEAYLGNIFSQLEDPDSLWAEFYTEKSGNRQPLHMMVSGWYQSREDVTITKVVRGCDEESAIELTKEEIRVEIDKIIKEDNLAEIKQRRNEIWEELRREQREKQTDKKNQDNNQTENSKKRLTEKKKKNKKEEKKKYPIQFKLELENQEPVELKFE